MANARLAGLALLCAALLGLPARADVDEQAKELKDQAYGNYWDRKKALRELAGMNTVEAARVIATVLGDKHGTIRELAARALADMDAQSVRQHVRQTVLLTDRNALARAGAAWAVRLAADEQAGAALKRALADRDWRVRVAAIRALVAIKEKSAAPLLEKLLAGRPAAVAAEAAAALGELGATDSYDKLVRLAGSRANLPRARALEAIGKLGPDRSAELLLAGLKGPRPEVRMGALFGLMASANRDAAFSGASARLPDEKDWRVRQVAATVLHWIREKRVLPHLIEQLGREKGRLRFDVAQMLTELTGKDLGFDAKSWKSWWEANKSRDDLIVDPRDPRDRKRASQAGGSVARYFGIPILSNAVVFSIDFSGSMKEAVRIRVPVRGSTDRTRESKSRRKIDHALDELEKALLRFKPTQKFGVLMMSTEAAKSKRTRSTGPRLLPARRSIAARGVRQVRATWATLEKIRRGRGDMWTTMVEGAAVPGTDTIFIISDGVPSDGDFTLRENMLLEWKRFNHYRRLMIHTLHIGEGRGGRRLLEELARQTGGVSLELVRGK